MVSDKALVKHIKKLQAMKPGQWGLTGDWHVRKKAAYKLGELGDVRAIEHLVEHACNANVLALDAIVKIGLLSADNLEIARNALHKLRTSGAALRAQMGHYRTTVQGNRPIPNEAVWLNTINSASQSLTQGRPLFTKQTAKKIIKE